MKSYTDKNKQYKQLEDNHQHKSSKMAQESQPLFLRKAFYMISNCDPNIAGWSKDGESFIVHDIERFAMEVIPTVYKHNKFSSFVRQLNFYGFRKVRTELYQANSSEFRHPYFRRGEDNLLSKIKKTKQVEEEVVDQPQPQIELTIDVSQQLWQLSEKMGALDEAIKSLSEKVRDLQEFDQDQQTSKRQRVEGEEEVDQQQQQQQENLAQMDEFEYEFWEVLGESLENDEDMIGNEGEEDEGDNTTTLSHSETSNVGKNQSRDSLGENDDEKKRKEITFQENNNSSVVQSSSDISSVPIAIPASSSIEAFNDRMIDSVRISDIKDILGILPTHLQERFIDRLATTVGQQLPHVYSNVAAVPVDPAQAKELTASTPVSLWNTYENLLHMQVPPSEPVDASELHDLSLAYPLASAALGCLVSYHLVGHRNLSADRAVHH